MNCSNHFAYEVNIIMLISQGDVKFNGATLVRRCEEQRRIAQIWCTFVRKWYGSSC